MKKILHKILPSKEIEEDVTFTYNKINALQPIQINELSLIKPMQKKLLKMRSQNTHLEIERSLKKMALIIPYRNREEHLLEFIPSITEYLNVSNIEFEIIIVEQSDTLPFNRAKLMNIGVLNASENIAYFVFHDVDLLPENIDYRYANHSLKLFTYIKQEDNSYKKYKQTNFGGATLVPKNIFYDINGFSNRYWQWGSEDDDFLMRHLLKGYVPFYDSEGKFRSLPHPHSLTRDSEGNYVTDKKVLKANKKLHQKNRKIFSLLKRGIVTQADDGVKQTDYKLIETKRSDTHLHLFVTL